MLWNYNSRDNSRITERFNGGYTVLSKEKDTPKFLKPKL